MKILAKSALFLLLPAAFPGWRSVNPSTIGGWQGTSPEEGRIEAIAAMLDEHPAGFGSPITTRAAWEKLAGAESFRSVIPAAESLLGSPLPALPDDLYLDFSRTGNRSRWQNVSNGRRARVRTLALAECLENKGRFLRPFEALVRELSAERTWVMPAHDRSLRNFRGEGIDIDLGSSALAWNLATADHLLAGRLDADTRRLIREQVRRRIFTPFQDMAAGREKKNFWMQGTNNWNAVCLTGVTGSALALIESRRERAFFIAAAEEYSKNFLHGFSADGYCSEGLGYWNYGFGHYLMLAEMISQATHGSVDLLAPPEVRAPATFASRIGIIGGVYPAFADCAITARPSERAMWFVSRRFRLGLHPWEDNDVSGPEGSLPEAMMYSSPNSASRTAPADKAATGPGLRTWFEQAGILICRPAEDSPSRFAVALKGGHNDEHHNHNDVGSYVVVSGTQAPLLDPGSEVYTARTFSAHRYDSNVLNSFGHPVPLVAGKMQKTGSDARAVVLRADFTRESDTLALDITSAYNVKGLKSLVRTFVYSRDGDGSLQVTDRVRFDTPQEFGSALITYDAWQEISPGALLIGKRGAALRIDIQSTGGDFEPRFAEIKEDVHSPVLPKRIGINLKQPVTDAAITVVIRNEMGHR